VFAKTHPHFRDVFIEIVRIQYRDEKRVKAKIRWWNRGYKGLNPYAISGIETFTFTNEKWNELINVEIEYDRQEV